MTSTNGKQLMSMTSSTSLKDLPRNLQAETNILLDLKPMNTIKAYRVITPAYGLLEGDVITWDQSQLSYTFKYMDHRKGETFEMSLSKGYVEDDNTTFEEIEAIVEETPIKDDAQSEAYEAEMVQALNAPVKKECTPFEDILHTRAASVKEEIDMLLSVEGSHEIATALVGLREQYWTLMWVLEQLNK